MVGHVLTTTPDFDWSLQSCPYPLAPLSSHLDGTPPSTRIPSNSQCNYSHLEINPTNLKWHTYPSSLSTSTSSYVAPLSGLATTKMVLTRPPQDRRHVPTQPTSTFSSTFRPIRHTQQGLLYVFENTAYSRLHPNLAQHPDQGPYTVFQPNHQQNPWHLFSLRTANKTCPRRKCTSYSFLGIQTMNSNPPSSLVPSCSLTYHLLQKHLSLGNCNENSL